SSVPPCLGRPTLQVKRRRAALIRPTAARVTQTMMEKRALQISIVIAALLPVVAGLWGIMQDAPDGAWTGNHRRYLSGLLLAIGLGYWSAIPEIETMATRLRLLTALVAVGGLARLLGLALGDALTLPVASALIMELLVAPLLCLWQVRITSRSRPVSPGPPTKSTPHLRHTLTRHPLGTLCVSRSATGSFVP
ncbi:MAG: DUF4345 domain-containing protein, partial [Reyranella sp.]|nr:DUF4345 domain-containing protein [Reyranella sp.]